VCVPAARLSREGGDTSRRTPEVEPVAAFPSLRIREALAMGGLSAAELGRRTWNQINENEIMTRAAAVSFYAMLTLVPFLGLVLTVTVQLLPDITGSKGRTTGIANLTTERFVAMLKEALPDDAYAVVADEVARLQHQVRSPLLLLLTGLAMTVWLASSLFVAIIDTMNRIYGVTETRSFLRIRLTAIVMTCVQAGILVGSLLAIVLWPLIVKWVGLSAPAAIVATAVQWLVVAVMVLLSFALTFYVGPDAEQRWEWITPGSVVGALIFLVASLGFRLYVQFVASFDTTYGSLGGVMVLLFWFWISSLVLLCAAQMNQVIEAASTLGKEYGQKVEPDDPPDFSAIPPEPRSG
jgi:membrane protein